ncbi:hypothetical protein [Phocaeicola coprocola]
MSLYEEIVGRGGVSPAYFFDSMTFVECAAFLRGMRRKERAELENTRLVMWAIFQSQSRKSLELDDVMKLEDENEPKKDISQEELKELRKRAKQMENKL